MRIPAQGAHHRKHRSTFLDGQSTEEFMLCAERALSRAFNKGGDRVEVYSKEQYEREEVEQY
jgi:hypothetical protein